MRGADGEELPNPVAVLARRAYGHLPASRAYELAREDLEEIVRDAGWRVLRGHRIGVEAPGHPGEGGPGRDRGVELS